MKKAPLFIVLALVASAGAAWAATNRSMAISATRAESISAAPDGGAWALTTQGTLMFCRFEEAKRVQCYDKDGATTVGY